jgi:glutathione synthase/RimK-type ligase-like ATP-grasp enzyme
METERKFNPENYVYFQEFIPQNDYDIRIIVIGKGHLSLREWFVKATLGHREAKI